MASGDIGVDTDEKEALMDMRSPLELVDEAVSLKVYSEVHFVNVQFFLADPSGNTAIISTPNTLIEIGELLDGTAGSTSESFREKSAVIGSRTKAALEKASIFVSKTGLSKTEYEMILPETNIYFCYNASNTIYSPSTGDLSKAASLGFGDGDTINILAPGLKLFMDSPQYCIMYALIVNLLVYRDPRQKERAEQLDSLVLARDILDKDKIIRTLEDLQDRVVRMESALLNYSFGTTNLNESKFAARLEKLNELEEALCLIFDSVSSIKSSAEKLTKKQTRLELQIVIDHIQWTLTHPDRSPMVSLTLQDIRNVWISNEDGSMSDLTEIGVILATNKSPDSFYKTLIEPLPQGFYTKAISSAMSQQIIRFYWKAIPPVGGIPIIEHVELNMSPLTIRLSRKITSEIFTFFFPTQPEEEAVQPSIDDTEFAMVHAQEALERKGTLSRTGSIKGAASLSRMESMEEILDMKKRAADHCSFVFIKIPASQHYVSYKVLHRLSQRY